MLEEWSLLLHKHQHVNTDENQENKGSKLWTDEDVLALLGWLLVQQSVQAHGVKILKF